MLPQTRVERNPRLPRLGYQLASGDCRRPAPLIATALLAAYHTGKDISAEYDTTLA
jgi:hypothetical protein